MVDETAMKILYNTHEVNHRDRIINSNQISFVHFTSIRKLSRIVTVDVHTLKISRGNVNIYT